MGVAREKPVEDQHCDSSPSRWVTIAWLLGMGLVLGAFYAPLLIWLGWASIHIGQLSAGAMLVVFAITICLWDTLETLRFEPAINNQGLTLLTLGFLSMGVAVVLRAAPLPLVLFSACLSLAGIISCLFGKLGVRQFLPALVGFLVFGLLAGLFPALDWPLRATAARHAARLLAGLGVAVQLGLAAGKPATLLLNVGGKLYEVATECSGFGLLTSALLVATMLAFQFRMPWPGKIGIVLVAVPVAIVCNYLRIVCICLIAPRVAWPYAFVHEAVGLMFYFLGLGIIWSIARRYQTSDPVKQQQAPS